MKVPRVFISYSHDSQAHKKWVMDFAVRLRNSGIDAILDQWELQPGDDIPHFMEREVAAADRVLMICTDAYVQRANAGQGGVGYEKMIVTADLMKSIDSRKVIPVIRQHGSKNVPTFLTTKLFIDFSRDQESEFSFDELVRALLGAPLFKKPPIGNSPFKPVSETPVEKTADAMLDVMKAVVAEFESHTHTWVLYSEVLKRVRMSRILLDITLRQAAEQRLVSFDGDGDIILSEQGKSFAIQHKLLK